MKRLLYLLLVILITTSCATGYYAPHNVNQFGTQTQVVLDQANFRIVRHLEVVIDINNTNLKRADVEKSAYAELLRRANLTGSQALINVVIEEVRRESMNIFRALFTGIPKVTQHVAARATIIEFLDANGQPIPSVSKYVQPTQHSQVAESSQLSIDTIVPAKSNISDNSTPTPKTTTISEQPKKEGDYEVNIPDSAFYNAIVKKVDTNKDGRITKSEAMAVTNLNLYAKKIKDMTGIEEFENITKISAMYNEFSIIDLSNNNKLTEVYVDSKYLRMIYLPHGSKAIVDVPKKYIMYK